MARGSSGVDSLVFYGGLAAVGLLAFRLAEQGKLGAEGQRVAGELRQAVGGTRAPASGGAPTPPGGGSPPSVPAGGGTTRVDPGHPCGAATGDIDAMTRANANFPQQMMEWQALRGQRGEDPTDWTAFRHHLTAIGAPDPGAWPPHLFCPTLGHY